VTPLYRHILKHVPFRFPVYNAVVAIESRLGSDRIKRLYRMDMEREFQSLLPALPPTCSQLLDIGCGVAGIDVLLDRHYAAQQPHLHLLDRTQINSSVYYLFEKQPAFYNSLEAARTLLLSNGIADERIHLLVANASGGIATRERMDLVVSLLSWGFHFPVDTYCQQVWERLRPSGVVILDVRKGSNGMDVLRASFGSVDVLCEDQKMQRVVATR
jgi:SAM-dependent methyltransferase